MNREETIKHCIKLAYYGIANRERAIYKSIIGYLEHFKEDKNISDAINSCKAGETLISPKFAYPRVITSLELAAKST